MKIRFIVWLIVVLCCCSEALALPGDVTTKVDIDFGNSRVGNTIAGKVGTMTISDNSSCPMSVNGGRLIVGKGTSKVSFSPATKNDIDVVSFEFAFGRLTRRTVGFNCKTASGTEVAYLSFCPYGDIATSSNLGLTDYDLYYGTNKEASWGNVLKFSIELNYQTEVVTTAIYMNGFLQACREVTIKGIEPIASFEVVSNYDNVARLSEFDNLKITTTEREPLFVPASYTLSYMVNGVCIKSVEKKGYVGNAPVVTFADKSSITYNGHRYVYYSDDASSRIVADDGSTKVLLNYMPGFEGSFPMEKINRSVIAVPVGDKNGVLVSWRRLASDDSTPDMVFDVYRDAKLVATNLRTTNFLDVQGLPSNNYVVMSKVSGVVKDVSSLKYHWSQACMTLSLDRPVGSGCTYTPNDCSVGDVDGDGEYELIVKWDPSDAQDNSNDGYTSNVYIDCYKFNGKKLWRIDLGKNIRAGAHYTQLLVYDFDGDGKAEMICKTAPGSKDGKGAFVSAKGSVYGIIACNNSEDFRNANGHVIRGKEFLTVFKGMTGEAIHTIWYNPNRAGSFNQSGDLAIGFWGDDKGNRSERFLATVAFLDGPSKNPSAVMCRGYYTRAYLWAVNFDGVNLSTKWLHASEGEKIAKVYDSSLTTSTDATNGLGGTAFGNGNHNLSVGDVDGDGCDEIIYGACAIDHDGKMLYVTGYGHGDAMHLADIDPDRPGLELFDVHEDMHGWDLHDAETGEIILSSGGDRDNGRGLAADISDDSRGLEFWSTTERAVLNSKGTVITTSKPSVNFRVYWDGDLQDNLLDGNVVTDWKGTSANTILAMSGSSCNGTKATPCLQADIFGDWREEIILYDVNDPSKLNIYSTNIPTPYLVTTPMQDHVYRMGIAWQNVGYNQPPHLGYYLPDVASVKVTFNGSGYAMFSSKKNVTVAGMNGVSAYRGGNISGDYINMYKVTEIPAGEGALLKGTANSTVYLPVIYAADEIAGNTLVGAPDGASVQANANYVLASAPTDELSVLASSTVASGSAYVVKGGNSASTLKFVLREGLAGDVNGDGILTIADVVLANKCLLGEITSGTFVTRSDWNGDGKVTRDDVDNIANAVMNQE